MFKNLSTLGLIALSVSACGSKEVVFNQPSASDAPAASIPALVQKAVTCQVYDLGYYPSALPDFDNLTPAVTVGLDKFSLGIATDVAPFPALIGTAAENYKTRVAYRCTGTLKVTQAGLHIIKTVSDDGVRVTIGGLKVIENNTSHGATANSVTLSLSAGNYSMVVEYFEGDGPKELLVTDQPAPTALNI